MSETLDYDLKKAISQRYFGNDGSVYGDPVQLDKKAVPYLEGLSDGGVDGAEELIAAIRQHDVVEIWIAG